MHHEKASLRRGNLGVTLGLAACGEDAPPPKPAAQPATTPPPQAAAPAPAPEAKAPEAPKPDPNKELAQRVKQALEGDAKVQAAAIDVTAQGGRVSLWGTTATAGERSRAGRSPPRSTASPRSTTS